MKITRRKRQRFIAILGVCGLLLVIYYYFFEGGREKISALNIIPVSQLNEGVRLMHMSKVIFVGICRDNAGEIDIVLDYIRHTASFFLDYRLIIFENDSTDETLKSLRDFQTRDPKLTIISKTFKNIKRPTTKFMADARNYYLTEMKKPEYDSFDYMIVVDMDMKYGWDMRSLIHPFSIINRWDVSCSNGMPTFFKRI